MTKSRDTWCEDLREFWKWHLFVKDIHSSDLLAVELFPVNGLKREGIQVFARVIRIPCEFLEENAMDEIHKLLGDCSYCARHLTVFGKACVSGDNNG
jgi:hypothetical protein